MLNHRTWRTIVPSPSIALLVFLLLGAGCHSRQQASTATRTVTDEAGNVVHLVTMPQRVISLAPNITEILFALDAGDRLIADTTYCTYPEAAKTKEKIGDTQNPNLERIIALKPDLVLISTASQLQDFAGRLSGLGIPVYVTHSDSLTGVMKTIEDVGDALGQPEKGKQLTRTMRDRILAVQNRVAGLPRPRVLFLLQESPPLFTVGPGAYSTDLIQLAGGDSISRNDVGPNPYPQLGEEAAVARRPEVIIFASSSTQGVEKLNEMPIAALKQTPAARNGQIYRVDSGRVVYAAPRIVDGLEDLAHILHPTAFDSSSASVAAEGAK